MLAEFVDQLSSGYAYDIHRCVLRDDTDTAQAMALGESSLTQRAMLPPAAHLRQSAWQHMTMLLEMLKSLPVAKWPDLTTMFDVDRGDSYSVQFSATAWALLNHEPGPWPRGVAGTLAKIALAMPFRPTVVAAAAFRHKEVFDLVRQQAAMWTDKAKQIHQFSLTKHRDPNARVGWVYVSKIQEVVQC